VKQEQIPVTVRILDKEYRVACDPQEQDGLLESARLVDRRMREMRQSGRIIGADRIAVMAALNIAHELIQLRHHQGSVGEGADSGRLGVLQRRIAGALDTQRELDQRTESV
jgi:cell division protein ZapA